MQGLGSLGASVGENPWRGGGGKEGGNFCLMSAPGQGTLLLSQGSGDCFSLPLSPSQLMEAIQKQEEINFRLQDYIDRIIVAIMETNPSILEVK